MIPIYFIIGLVSTCLSMSISWEKKGQLANNWCILSILMEKKMATHSSILPWEIPWTEEPGRLQSIGSQESEMTQQQQENIVDRGNEALLLQSPARSCLRVLHLLCLLPEICLTQMTPYLIFFSPHPKFHFLRKVFSTYPILNVRAHTYIQTHVRHTQSPFSPSITIWPT